jgi:hypothetical protein
MSRFCLLAGVGIIVLLVSGCLSVITDRQVSDTGGPEITVYNVGSGSGEPEEVEISVLNLSTDKEIYHSAEVMNLSVLVGCGSDLDNVQVTAKGINGRMNLKKTLNLSAGETWVSFAYTLPRCNVCGGIREGSYGLDSEVSYGNITVKNSTSVEIRQ